MHTNRSVFLSPSCCLVDEAPQERFSDQESHHSCIMIPFIFFWFANFDIYIYLLTVRCLLSLTG